MCLRVDAVDSNLIHFIRPNMYLMDQPNYHFSKSYIASLQKVNDTYAELGRLYRLNDSLSTEKIKAYDAAIELVNKRVDMYKAAYDQSQAINKNYSEELSKLISENKNQKNKRDFTHVIWGAVGGSLIGLIVGAQLAR